MSRRHRVKRTFPQTARPAPRVEMIPIDKLRLSPYGTVPLRGNEYAAGLALFERFRPNLTASERAFLDGLEPGDYEIARGYLLAVMTGKDGFCPLPPSDPLIVSIHDVLKHGAIEAIRFLGSTAPIIDAEVVDGYTA